MGPEKSKIGVDENLKISSLNILLTQKDDLLPESLAINLESFDKGPSPNPSTRSSRRQFEWKGLKSCRLKLEENKKRSNMNWSCDWGKKR